jgi:hypothetical protein
MRFTHDQHMEMSKRLHERSIAERNPEATKKKTAMVKVFRQPAEGPAEQARNQREGEPATSQQISKEEPSRLSRRHWSLS